MRLYSVAWEYTSKDKDAMSGHLYHHSATIVAADVDEACKEARVIAKALKQQIESIIECRKLEEVDAIARPHR